MSEFQELAERDLILHRLYRAPDEKPSPKPDDSNGKYTDPLPKILTRRIPGPLERTPPNAIQSD